MIKSVLLFYIFFSLGFPQDLDYLFNQYEKGELNTIIKTLPELRKVYPKNAGVLYLTALTQLDADTALEIYKTIIKNFSTSEYASGASSKIGHYLYARGLYSQASRQFKKNIFDYPDSKDISRNMGMMIRSYDAIGELDSAQIFIHKYANFYPNHKINKHELGLIPLEISGLNLNHTHRETNENISVDQLSIKKYWMIQVGAFGVKKNAENLKNKLSEGNYSTSTHKLSTNNRTLFGVRVGPISDHKIAINTAKKLQSDYGLDYQLLEMNEK
jgi:tetratricopeptide (TPR) repeat protein